MCGEQAVTPLAVIAALFDSDSRCSACGSAVTFGSNAYGGFAACVIVGFVFGYLVSNFVVGGIVGLILVAAGLRVPLKADATDSTAARGIFRKRGNNESIEKDDRDPVDRGE